MNDYPRFVPVECCEQCDEEMLFAGISPMGFARLLCEECRYRYDIDVREQWEASQNDAPVETHKPVHASTPI